MKRIYESIPLRSVLYLIGGLQEIEVRDYESKNAWLWRTDNYKVVFKGQVKDTHSKLSDKQDRAKVYGIDIEDGVIRFSICTKYEEI